jgi:hypothetical protein
MSGEQESCSADSPAAAKRRKTSFLEGNRFFRRWWPRLESAKEFFLSSSG